jgi:hypothetical protein
VHQRVERIELDDLMAGIERLAETTRGAQGMRMPMMGVDPRGIECDGLAEFPAGPVGIGEYETAVRIYRELLIRTTQPGASARALD